MNPNSNLSDTSSRISILRFVMIFGIVILHIPPFVPIDLLEPGVFSYIKAFFQSALFRCTVPVLSFISGYLLFRSGIDTKPRLLLAKKIHSLVVPFLVFNLPFVAVALVLQMTGKLDISYQLVPFNWSEFADAAFSLRRQPINYPLFFLRDLFVICLLAPVFGMLLRRSPELGLILISLVFLADFDRELVMRTAMPVSFCIGGYLAVRNFNVRALDKYAVPCLVLFLIMCAAIVIFRVVNTTALRLISPVLIWPAASLLLGTRFGRWAARMSKYSFFIFLAHAPVLLLSWKLYLKYGQDIPYQVYWVATPVLTTMLLIGVHRLCTKYIPAPFAWARGVQLSRLRAHGVPASLHQ
jgi:succinoglycan biosynthesis protein ExoH